MTKVIGVRFRTAGKIYYFSPGKFEIKQGDHVIVETARGVEYGKVDVYKRQAGGKTDFMSRKKAIVGRTYFVRNPDGIRVIFIRIRGCLTEKRRSGMLLKEQRKAVWIFMCRQNII